jgi:predicted component of type VI protein secretion system
MRISVQIEFDKTLDLWTDKNDVVVGRSASHSDLAINHASISRKHCRVEYSLSEDAFYITDLSSSNGTTINDVKLAPQVRKLVPKNAELKIGGLICELSHSIRNMEPEKILSSSTDENKDYTSTLRLARIDLEAPNLQIDQRPQSTEKKSRNPVLSRKNQPQAVAPKREIFWPIVVGVGIILLAWFLAK